VRLRQIQQFLNSSAEAEPEQVSPAERDQRLCQLVSASRCIRPGVEKRDHALQSIRLQHRQDGEQEDGDENNQQEVPQARARKKQNAAGHGDQHYDGTEVRLQQQHPAQQADQRQRSH